MVTGAVVGGAGAGGAADGRHERLDLLRALAIVWMVLFHFAFDLNHFDLLTTPKLRFHADPMWSAQRLCIVSLFLFCAGLSQAVVLDRGQAWNRFWRRWAQVAVGALLVTLGSYVMFPRSFIYMGVLHGIALMLIVTRLTARWGPWLWLAGAIALLAPRWLRDPMFNTPWLTWTGLVTRKPVTEDYVPLLPWLGVMWWGMAAGQWLLRHRRAWLSGPVPRLLHPLLRVGQWPLTIYLVHQPVLIGALMAYLALTGRPAA